MNISTALGGLRLVNDPSGVSPTSWPSTPRLAQERLVLVASFTALRDVSDRQALQRQLPTSASEDRRASSPN